MSGHSETREPAAREPRKWIYLPTSMKPEQAAALRAYADQEELNLSTVIRRIVVRFLREQGLL